MRKVAAPSLITLSLSAAAVLGYLGYRWYTVPAEPDAAAPTALAEQLPEFTLEGLDGQPLGLDSWPGKPLLVNFWATWCAPCLREIPMLKKFQDEHDWLQVVGVAVDSREPVLRYAEEMQFNYPIMIGQSEAMQAAASFGIEFFALPFTAFTAADGSLLGVHTGEIHIEHLENLRAVLEDLAAERIDKTAARARIAGQM